MTGIEYRCTDDKGRMRENHRVVEGVCIQCGDGAQAPVVAAPAPAVEEPKVDTKGKKGFFGK